MLSKFKNLVVIKENKGTTEIQKNNQDVEDEKVEEKQEQNPIIIEENQLENPVKESIEIKQVKPV